MYKSNILFGGKILNEIKYDNFHIGWLTLCRNPKNHNGRCWYYENPACSLWSSLYIILSAVSTRKIICYVKLILMPLSGGLISWETGKPTYFTRTGGQYSKETPSISRKELFRMSRNIFRKKLQVLFRSWWLGLKTPVWNKMSRLVWEVRNLNRRRKQVSYAMQLLRQVASWNQRLVKRFVFLYGDAGGLCCTHGKDQKYPLNFSQKSEGKEPVRFRHYRFKLKWIFEKLWGYELDLFGASDGLWFGSGSKKKEFLDHLNKHQVFCSTESVPICS